MLRTLASLFAAVLSIATLVEVGSVSLTQMNEQSDVAVLFGALGIVACVGVAAVAVKCQQWIWEKTL